MKWNNFHRSVAIKHIKLNGTDTVLTSKVRNAATRIMFKTRVVKYQCVRTEFPENRPIIVCNADVRN